LVLPVNTESQTKDVESLEVAHESVDYAPSPPTLKYWSKLRISAVVKKKLKKLIKKKEKNHRSV